MNFLRDLAQAIALALSFCAAAHATVMRFESHVSEPQNLPTDRPEVNPAPHKIVTIRGQKDRRIEAWFVVTYSTTNDACRTRTLSQALAGAPEIPQSIRDYIRVPAGQTTFSVRFFIDRYVGGRCGWSPIAIGNAVYLPEESNGPGAISGFIVIRNEGSDHLSAQYNCRRRVARGNAEPHFYLVCLPTGPTIRANDALATDGGRVDVEMRLDTSAERPAPEPANQLGS